MLVRQRLYDGSKQLKFCYNTHETVVTIIMLGVHVSIIMLMVFEIKGCKIVGVHCTCMHHYSVSSNEVRWQKATFEAYQLPGVHIY